MIIALQESLGVVTTAAKKADINPKTHYEWLKNDAEYAERVRMVAEEAIDFVETKMFDAISNSDSGLIKYYLSTKGKSRGYVERVEARQVDEQGNTVAANETNITITFE